MAELPIGETISPTDRQSLFLKVEDVPHGNRDLAYSILVPRTWGVDSSLKAPSPQLPIGTLKPLGIFQGPAATGLPPYLQIQATRLNRDITMQHWLRHFALSQGHRIEQARELSPHFADQLSALEIEGVAFKMRTIARLDGDRLFLVAALAPSDQYGELEQLLGLMVASFELKNPSRQRLVENRDTRTVGGQVRVQYPLSWKPREPAEQPEGKHVLDLYHLDDSGNPAGLMRIKVVDRTLTPSPEALRAATLEEFSEAGIEIRSLAHEAPVENSTEHYKSGVLAIYLGVIPEHKLEQELWIYSFEMTRGVAVLTLLTPARTQSFYLWAVNKRAFELTLDTLRAIA